MVPLLEQGECVWSRDHRCITECLPANDGRYSGRLAELSRYPRMRAGRNKIARTNANIASNERATARNGKERSHIRGQRMMARMATGQHSTNKTRHKSKVFIGIPFNSCASP